MVEADETFKKCLLQIIEQQPELFGRHAREFAHRMATLIMAYGSDLESEESGESEDEHKKEEADGPLQSAYERNKRLVPLADLFNAGTSHIRSDSFVICTSV